MRAVAIIGAAFGDEGKGLMTDFFADESSIVVRHNGGAQAGHTVCAPSGPRHVFSHIGAGSLRGAATYLSESFIVNPTMFEAERIQLDRIGVSPKVFYHPGARMTTPFDVLLNQQLEIRRGGGRHGSCGMGINETVVRCETEFKTFAYRLPFEPAFDLQLRKIYRKWVPERMRQLGMPNLQLPHPAETIIKACMANTECFQQRCTVAPAGILREFKTVIFEGAQGLLLDEQHRFFPHVTRSRTGLTNVVPMAMGLGVDELTVVYVLRTYMTRHGAGPFPTECDAKADDRTNKPNKWQGSLRIGHLDAPLISEAINNDLTAWRDSPIPIRPCLAITHTDESIGSTSESPHELVSKIEQLTGLHVGITSNGPTRDDVSIEDPNIEKWLEKSAA